MSGSRQVKGQFGAGSGKSSSASFFTQYTLPFDASWEPDFWGAIRNTVKANRLTAEASFADLENSLLTVQSEAAVDYFELRAQDTQQELLDSTVAAYAKVPQAYPNPARDRH